MIGLSIAETWLAPGVSITRVLNRSLGCANARTEKRSDSAKKRRSLVAFTLSSSPLRERICGKNALHYIRPSIMRGASLFLICCACLSAQSANVAYEIDTLAGSNFIGDNGSATLAILTQAEGVAADKSGNLYIADAGMNRIRMVDRAGTIATIAGTGVAGFSGDGGPASAAQLNAPYGIVLDGIGNLYIADLGNARVRKIGLDGNIATLAGGGSLPPAPANEGSPATMMRLSAPRNLAFDSQGALYISDFIGHRIFRVDSTGTFTTFAGTGIPGLAGDNGSPALAELSFPAGLAF